MFLRAKPPIYHIEGVPLAPNRSLAFVPEYSFIQGLSWYHKTVGERRPEFPSWSWTGWTGELADQIMLDPRSIPGPYDISNRLEYENEIIGDFPKENEWQDFLSRTTTIRVKFLHIKGQTLKCILARTANESDMAHLQDDRNSKTSDDYLLKFEMEKNTAFYVHPVLDLVGSQIEGKPLESICLFYEAEKKLARFAFPMSLLIATNTDGVSERVGCSFHDYTYCIQDGKPLYPDAEICLAMLEKKFQLRTIRLG